VSDILKRLDLNQNQKIDLTEFLCALCNLEQYFEQEYVSELFNLFDRNGDGFIDRKELKLTLEECQGEEIAYLFQLIDSNKDDRISLEEFRSFILHQRARDAKV
jgi:Ca2+-binding EF-hand superfamily protein